MRKVLSIVALAGAFLIPMLFAAPSYAQATRTWISGVGDDANPCSRTAPCKTFPGAIAKTAAGGEIDCLDPAGYGAVTITKSITLDCGGGMGGQVGSILVSGTNGINVNAGATDKIKIRNMTINGINGLGLSAIKVNTGAAVIVEHVGIFGFGASSNPGINFAPQAAGTELYLRDVEIQHGANDGVLLAPVNGVAATAVFDNVVIFNNNGVGLKVQDGVVATIVRTNISGNTGKGVNAIASLSGTIVLNLEDSIVASNGAQGVVSNGAATTVRLSNTGIYNNTLAGLLSLSSGTILSWGNNRIGANAGNSGNPTTTVPQL